MSKYHLDAQSLGPWMEPYNFLESAKQDLNMPTGFQLTKLSERERENLEERQERAIQALVKQVKNNLRELSDISLLGKRNIIGKRPAKIPTERKGILSSERIPGTNRYKTESMTQSV